MAAAKVFVLQGELTDEEFEKIKKYLVNPIEAREAALEKPETLEDTWEEPADVERLEGFLGLSEADVAAMQKELGLAMSVEDLLWIQKYFKEEEKRVPTITEIRVLDTYWSDHCRHTTFMTNLDKVEIEPGYYTKPIEEAFKQYLAIRDQVYGKDTERPITLMDMACIATKKLKKENKFPDNDDSEEINACSIVVPIEIDGKTEDWLVMFKNETHNHPTEIEPFGGRRHPGSPVGPCLCVPGHACNGGRRSPDSHRKDAGREAAPAEADHRGGGRLFLLRQSDRLGYRPGAGILS